MNPPTPLKIIVTAFLSLGLPLAAATFNIRDFGATGDGKTLDTAAIQGAVDAALAAGGGTVLVPPGRFLTDPFTLASHIDLHLASNAVILIDNDISRYPAVKKRYQDAITAKDAQDLSITGEGTIDGQGEAWWDAFRADPHMMHRPYMIKFEHCTGLHVSGVTLCNSPMFHLVPQNCTDVTIHGITIKAPANAPNTDGIDPSGWNFQITDCNIDTGDDDIAIKPTVSGERSPGDKNYTVKHCTFGHGHGMSVGGGTAGGLENLTVDDCTFNQTDYGIRIKTTRNNGGLLKNCLYENLTMTAMGKSPISIVDYYPERNAPKDPAIEKAEPVTDRTPRNENIVIKNLTATNCPNAGIIRGLPEAPIDGLTFSNVNISAKTGMIIYHAKGVRFMDSTVSTQDGKPPLKTFDAEVTGLK